MRTMLTFILLALTATAAADSFTVHPTIPGTSFRDWLQPDHSFDFE